MQNPLRSPVVFRLYVNDKICQVMGSTEEVIAVFGLQSFCLMLLVLLMLVFVGCVAAVVNIRIYVYLYPNSAKVRVVKQQKVAVMLKYIRLA